MPLPQTEWIPMLHIHADVHHGLLYQIIIKRDHAAARRKPVRPVSALATRVPQGRLTT